MIRTLLRLLKLWFSRPAGRTADEATPADLSRLTATVRQACDEADTALAQADASGWELSHSARVVAATGTIRQATEALCAAARAVDERAVAMDRVTAQLRTATPDDFKEGQ